MLLSFNCESGVVVIRFIWVELVEMVTAFPDSD